MLRSVIPLSIFLTVLLNTVVFSKIFMTRDEALKVVFPEAETIAKKTVFINKQQAKEIESIAKAKLESKIYVFYVGKKGNETLGYAVIDTHRLRTRTETVIVVINPDGSLRSTEILAFFEPREYMPGQNWIKLLRGKSLNDSFRIGKDIPNITGATITSDALLQTIRRILAVFQVILKGND